MALSASVPGMTFPYLPLGDWLGALAMFTRRYSGGRHRPRVQRKGPQTFRKSLDKNWCLPASVLHLKFFSLIGKPYSWIFFGSSFLLKMRTGTLGGGAAGRGAGVWPEVFGIVEAGTGNEFAVLIEPQASVSYPMDVSKEIKMTTIITSCIVCWFCAGTVLIVLCALSLLITRLQGECHHDHFKGGKTEDPRG